MLIYSNYKMIIFIAFYYQLKQKKNQSPLGKVDELVLFCFGPGMGKVSREQSSNRNIMIEISLLLCFLLPLLLNG